MASLFGISNGKSQEKEDVKERWEETADLEVLRKEVQERLKVLLERKGSRNSVTAENQIASLPPFFIDKCLRQRGGLKVQRCAELCVNFLEFPLQTESKKCNDPRWESLQSIEFEV